MVLEPLNEKLIAKVIHHITEDYRRYDQNTVAERWELDPDDPDYRHIPVCKTKACFGGWTVILSTPVRKRLTLDFDKISLDEAQKLLGLTHEESEFLFDGANGEPKSDLKIIKQRLADIRISRQCFEAVAKLRTHAEKKLKQADMLFEYDEE